MNDTVTINWEHLDVELRDRYEGKLPDRDSVFHDVSMNIKSLAWIDHQGCRTEAYRVFVKEVNRLQLAVNLFENLVMFEDIRHEQEGIGDFVIDMPRKYLRFPDRNNIRCPFTYAEVTSEESDRIDQVILESREAMNLRNDENIVREHFHRLEFLALFSYFEAFLQEILATSLGGTEEHRLEANKFVMHNSLPETVNKVANDLNASVLQLLQAISPDILEFLHYCYLVRNAHTHAMGRATNHLISQGKKFGSLRDEEIRNVDGELLGTEIQTTASVFAGPDRVEKGRYINLSLIVALFRAYSEEIALIFDRSMPRV